MPRFTWEEIEELKHYLERIRNYHCENILREKILLDAIKETIDRVDELILKQED